MPTVKYIAGEIRGFPAAVLFNESTQHVHVASVFSEVYSAGFVGQNAHGVLYVYGHSESLNVQANPTHAKLVARALPDRDAGKAVPHSALRTLHDYLHSATPSLLEAQAALDELKAFFKT